MAGTIKGAEEAQKSLLRRLGSKKAVREFYQEIGRKGGMAVHEPPRGFAAMSREERSLAGAKGGRISRRTKKQVKE